ncbi:MAG: FAD-dependent thymidylate synthase [Clostridium sp.]|jgi:thymidylate synthase ThyX|nr:FAD-dependent thymidylate synthase [Clostridium sp.]
MYSIIDELFDFGVCCPQEFLERREIEAAMDQKVKIVARTFEVDETDHPVEDLVLLAGKAAGVCYMPDDYMQNGIQDAQRAMKRAQMTAKSGHHSVFDHGNITFLLETSKMMAMILNSVGFYTTSEKSARYTTMKPQTFKEQSLYEKWTDRIQSEILRVYTDMKEKDAQKLAGENARYFISVFTPTVMEYTVSFRQAHLIHAYLLRLYQETKDAANAFYRQVGEEARQLAYALHEKLGDFALPDYKNQQFRFLEAIANVGHTTAKKEVLGDSYTMVYMVSFAALAQLQRHRTLRYTMFFDGDPYQFGFYVPAIVEYAGLTREWTKDMKEVAATYPQGLLVRVTEQGIFEDFALKCKERMCGRTQLETMRATMSAMRKFHSAKNLLSEANTDLLLSMTAPDAKFGSDTMGLPTPAARCRFADYTCTQGCRWGAKDSLTRLI